MAQPEFADNPYQSPADSYLRGDRSSKSGKLIFKAAKYASFAILALFALRLFGILGITYRSRFDNEPLQNAVRVVRNSNEELELADGRVVTNFWDNDRLAEVMKRTRTNQVELSRSDLGPGKVDVVAKDYLFICGIGDPLFTIPLIPIRVPRYTRATIGYGEFSPSKTKVAAP